MQNKIVFDSGVTLTDAKIYGGVNYHQVVNASVNYDIGTVACAEVSFTSLDINHAYINQWFTWYTKQAYDVEHGDNWRKMGRYKVLDVNKAKTKYIVKAYDSICDFDNKDQKVYNFIDGLEYPISLGNLFSQLCQLFNKLPYSNQFLNSDFIIYKKPDIKIDCTGRQMLNYIAEASASFILCRAQDNKIEVRQYTANRRQLEQLDEPTFVSIDEDTGIMTVSIPDQHCVGLYVSITADDERKQGIIVDDEGNIVPKIDYDSDFDNTKYVSFDYQDYYTPTIDYIKISNTSTNEVVSAGYSIQNAIEIVDNPLLALINETPPNSEVNNREEVQELCNNIYDVVHNMVYIPSETVAFSDYEFECGDIIMVNTTDNTGAPIVVETLVMEKDISSSGVSFSCKGEFTRDSGKVKEQETQQQSGGGPTEYVVSALPMNESGEPQNNYNVLVITDQNGMVYKFYGGGGVARFA